MRYQAPTKTRKHGLIYFILAACLYCMAASHTGWAQESHPIPADLLMGDTLREPSWGDLPELLKSGAILACTTYSPSTFFVAPKGDLHGFEYSMLREWETSLNKKRSRKLPPVKLVLVPMAYELLIPSLLSGHCDVVAAGLTITPERKKKANFTAAYLTGVKELVVANSAAPALVKIEDLSGQKVLVRPSSSYHQSLASLNRRLRGKEKAPAKILAADETLSDDDLLEMVNAGIEPYTVVDSHIAHLWRGVLPELVIYEDLALREGGEIAWMVRNDNPKLKVNLDRFMSRHRKGTLKGNIFFKRYFQGKKWITNPLGKDDRERLNRYLKWFKKYSARYDMDWLLMAAQGYQESRLDQSARSPAGALGIMQLMPFMADDKRLGIKNIGDAEQNVHAGIKYMALLRDEYFDDPQMSPHEQMRFSLAAYNAGPGNVDKVRRLAKKLGYDPNIWFGNCEMAALKVVGSEPVRYVRNINKYYVALKLSVAQEDRRDELRRQQGMEK